MILLDYSAVAIASVMVTIYREGIDKVTESACRYTILDSVRANNVRFRQNYGEMYVCCDSRKKLWRESLFPYYKFKRKEKKKKDTKIDWRMIYRCLNDVKCSLRDEFPFHVVEVDHCEADEVIGITALESTEPTIIVSNDKDFGQCHENDLVCQYRPNNKEVYKEPNPQMQLKNLIIRGDADDGVPNFLSPDNIFTINGKKQNSIYTKKADEWLADDSNSFLDTDQLKRDWCRNQVLINFGWVPDPYPKLIRDEFNASSPKPFSTAKLMTYLANNRMAPMIPKVSDFKLTT